MRETPSCDNPSGKPLPARRLWLQVCLLIAAFMLAYFGAIRSLVQSWAGRDDYSHGFLIPFISLYFVWSEREKLERIQIHPSMLSGLVLIFIGSGMYWMGTLGGVVMVQQVSVVFTVPGLVLMLLGTQFLWALVLPLSYLIFMIPPFFDPLIQRLHWPLQLFSAVTASKILHLSNIPVFQRANFLELPGTTLEVADACSGVRYLISIIALGIPLAYVTQRTLIRRVLLIAAGIIIGVIINPLRITLIALWAYYGGQITHGPLHIFQGLFVSVIGFILLYVLAWGFAKIPYRVAGEPRHINSSVGVRPDIDLKQINLIWLAAVIMLFCFAGFVHLYKPVPVPLQSSIAGMPLTVGDWRGEELRGGMNPFKIAGADYELSRIYRNASGHELRLQIVYFETQRGKDKELINYKLDDLYRNSEKITIPVSTQANVQINKAVMRNGTDDSLVLYWYDLNGRIVADNYKGKLFTALDGLLRRRTNGAMIVVSSTLGNPEAKDAMMNQNVVFIQKIFPLLASLFQ